VRLLSIALLVGSVYWSLLVRIQLGPTMAEFDGHKPRSIVDRVVEYSLYGLAPSFAALAGSV
jgi:hypothetical protein